MKCENIYIGMRVKVKKSSPLTNAVGKCATVIDKPYDGYKGAYVQCLIDGDDDVWTFEDCNIKISDEKPVVGDRTVMVNGEPPYHHAVDCVIRESLGEICSLKSNVKVLEQKLQAISDVLKGDVK